MGMSDTDLEQWKTQKTWEESLEHLKEMIPGLYPQWTDYNLHDPGMTLLELAAWLGQIQEYQLRQIGHEHQKGFLKLLGVRPVKQKPGQTYVTVDAGESLFLPAGTRFYADHIPFETREDQKVTEGIFKRFVMREGDVSQVLEGEWLREGRGVSIQPFGRNPRKGNCLEIHLCRPLEPCMNHRLYMEFSHPGGRIPVRVDEAVYDGHGYYRLADIRMEYLGEDGWHGADGPDGWDRADGWQGADGPDGWQRADGPHGRPGDDTYSFVQDGSILFSLGGPMKEENPCLRFLLERTDYIAAPCITRISLAMARVWQQETVPREELPVFTGTGFPDQSFELGDSRVDEDEFCLAAECPVPEYPVPECPVPEYPVQECPAPEFPVPERSVPECPVPGRPHSESPVTGHISRGFCRMREYGWRQREDFHCSGPEDCHYVLEDGVLRFGNGMRGMMPEGLIRVKHMVRTLGDEGNIKSGTINRMDGIAGEDVRLIHEMDVTGGTDRETVEAAMERFCREQEESWDSPRQRAVTLRDYERLVMSAPGLMIEECRAYSLRAGEIILAVKPCSDQRRAVLSKGYEKNIYRFLEEKRMIGTKLRVVPPDYYDVTIVCTVCARVQYRMADRMVEDAVREWVEARGFGQGIPYGQLLGMIDSLPCVQQVSSLGLDSGGRGKRTPRGDLLLPPGGLLCLKRVTCNLMTPMRERT